MMRGFAEHPEAFPHANIALLNQAYEEFAAADNKLFFIQSQAAVAAANKLEKFRKLQAAMKQQIRQASADCYNDPVKLSYINWGPKAAGHTLEVPAQPNNLKITAIEGSTVFLSWNKSSRKRGGPVRMYIIERWQQNGNSSPNWQLAAASYNPQAALKNQPTGIKLAYQVKASNAAGESCPTNMVTAVL